MNPTMAADEETKQIASTDGDVNNLKGKAAGKKRKAGGKQAKGGKAGGKKKKKRARKWKAKAGKGKKGKGKKRKKGSGKAKKRKHLTAEQAAKYLLYFQTKAKQKSIDFYTKWGKELTEEGKNLQKKLKIMKDKMYTRVQTILDATEAMCVKMRKVAGEQAEFERQMDLGKDMTNMKIRNDVEVLRARLQSQHEEYDRCVKVIEKHLNQDEEISELKSETFSLSETLKANREAHAARLSQIEQRHESSVASSAARTARIIADMERIASEQEVERMPLLALETVRRNRYLRRESEGVCRESQAVHEYVEALECKNLEFAASTSFPVDWTFGGLVDAEEIELEAEAAALKEAATCWDVSSARTAYSTDDEDWETDKDEDGEEASNELARPANEATETPKLSGGEKSVKAFNAAGSDIGSITVTRQKLRSSTSMRSSSRSKDGSASSKLSSIDKTGHRDTKNLPSPKAFATTRTRPSTGTTIGRSGSMPKLPRNPFPQGSLPCSAGSSGKATPTPSPRTSFLPPLLTPSRFSLEVPGANPFVGPIRVVRHPQTLTPSLLLRDEEAANVRGSPRSGIVVSGTRKPISRAPPVGGPQFYMAHRMTTMLSIGNHNDPPTPMAIHAVGVGGAR